MTRSSVEGHDLFFSRIISMISTDMYNHTAAREVVDSNAKYYKHKKVALAADERKLASNKKKLLKYAVDNSETEPMEYAETNNDDDYHQDTSVSEGKDNFGESDGAYQDVVKPSLEELRLRLQSRILGLKSMRTSTKDRDPNFAGEKSQTSRKKARKDHVKRKPSKPSDAADSKMDVQDNDNSFEASNESNGSSHHHVESTSIDDFGDVQFSLISAKKAADESKNSSLSKPGTKMKRLKRMLETADKKRQRLDELKSAGSAGANRLKQEQWTDALKSATGEKTLNDSTKLRKAIKKREKKKETSAREWKGRLDTVESEKTARIAKREENINVKKLGKAPAVAAGAEDREKVGAGSGRPRLGFPKPGSQPEGEGGKTAIKSAGGDKFKGGAGAGKSKGAGASKVRAGFEGKTNAGFLNKNGGGGGKGGSGAGGKRK